MLLSAVQCFAQKKKPADATPDTAKLPVKIIYKTIPAEKPAETEIIPLYETKTTVVRPPGSKRDTIFADKKKKAPDVAEMEDKKKPRIVWDTGVCQCVAMELKTRDTLNFGEYITYSFIFKNNCKDIVSINSSSFRFTALNAFGKQVRVLRKVAFVKRFDIPEFVKLSPGETYEFKFADDAFFEYELHKSELYKFVFTHSNSTQKHKAPKTRTYLCTEWRDKQIFVK